MIKEILLKELVKIILGFSENLLKKSNLKLGSGSADITSALEGHLREVKNWSAEINFKDLKSQKTVFSAFIELDFFLFPRKRTLREEDVIEVLPLTKLFETTSRHVVILGQPGAGKTTSAKFLCQSIMFDENFYPNLFHYPLLIKLRDFNKPRSSQSAGIIVEFIYSTLGLRIDDLEKQPNDLISKLKEKLVVEILNKTKALLIVEGLDELIYQKHREDIITEIGTLVNQVENSRILVTGRTAEFNHAFENISIFELCPLSPNQISQFALKWLGSQESADAFLRDVHDSPFADTTIRPLTIAYLCAIYERVGKIPDKPKTVYRKVVGLLLDEWDEQRNVKRSSQYANFETDRKFEFLMALSFHLTVTTKRAIFTLTELANAYKRICADFDLEISEASEVAKELESHTGLFIESSLEFFEFAHKSIQEYLTAEYIVKLPSIPNNKKLLSNLPNELAIAVAISSNASLYFIELTTLLTKMRPSMRFIQTFMNRLLLEKAEFNKQPRLGFAALALYSHYLNSGVENGQLTLFVVDSLVQEFEKFIKSIFKRNTLDEITKYYERTDAFDSANGTKILVLKRKRDDRRVLEMKLPKLLNCRDSFLSGK